MANKEDGSVILRWPLIDAIAALGYRLFTRHRHTISTPIMGKEACQACKNRESRL